jgi:hypothetical protein
MQSKHYINFLISKIVNQLKRHPYAMLYLVLISREFFRNIDIFKSFSHDKVVKFGWDFFS